MNKSTPSTPLPARTLALGALTAVACSAGCNLTAAEVGNIIPRLTGDVAEQIGRDSGLGERSKWVRTVVEFGAIAITSQIRANEKQKAEAAAKAKIAYESAPPEVQKKIDDGEVKMAVKTSDGKIAVTDREGKIATNPQTSSQDVYDVPKDEQTRLANAQGNGKLNDMNVWYSDN